MNTLHGTGTIFLQAGGTVMRLGGLTWHAVGLALVAILARKQLAEDEELVVEQGTVLAFERTVQLDIRKTGSCLVAWLRSFSCSFTEVCCCGGMGHLEVKTALRSMTEVFSMQC